MYETGQMELEDIETFYFQIFNGNVDVGQYNIQDSNDIGLDDMMGDPLDLENVDVGNQIGTKKTPLLTML
jgi:hypothetical protein